MSLNRILYTFVFIVFLINGWLYLGQDQNLQHGQITLQTPAHEVIIKETEQKKVSVVKNETVKKFADFLDEGGLKKIADLKKQNLPMSAPRNMDDTYASWTTYCEGKAYEEYLKHVASFIPSTDIGKALSIYLAVNNFTGGTDVKESEFSNISKMYLSEHPLATIELLSHIYSKTYTNENYTEKDRGLFRAIYFYVKTKLDAKNPEHSRLIEQMDNVVH